MTPLRRLLALSVAIGAVVPVVAARADVSSFLTPIVCALIAGALGGWIAPGRIGESAIAVAVGVIFGLSVDAAVGSLYFNSGRNLIGIEWILWIVVLGIPFALANWAVSALRKARQQKANDGA